MRNRTAVILFALIGILLFMPMFEQITNLWDVKKLDGVEIPKPMPTLTLDSYSDGSFQRDVEDHLKQNFGFRAPIIRLYNQYLWDFYKKTYVSEDQVALGKDGWLYDPWSVRDYHQQLFSYYANDSAEMASMLSREAQRVLQLQRILESHGTHLFVFMTPAKDMIYPEYLPENQNTRLVGEPSISARLYNENEYTRLGINHLNIEQWFLQIKDTVDFMLFPKTGMHWTRYAAVHVADTLIRYMEHLADFNMKNLVLGQSELHSPMDPDDDLESLLNLMRPLSKTKYQYANVATDGDANAKKPKIIIIGDSFWWSIADNIPRREVFSEAPYWYYFQKVYYDSRYHSIDELDLAEELLSSDFVILAYCSTQQYRMNNGFTQKALAALTDYSIDSAAFVELEIQRTISSIMTTPEWMNSIREKAARNGKSVGQSVRENAIYTVNTRIKKGTLIWPGKEKDHNK